jgi:hypothetical protein
VGFDVAHVLTIYGRGPEDDLLYDLECRANRAKCRARCAPFEACGCTLPEWASQTIKGHRCPHSQTGEHQWEPVGGQWVSAVRGCWVLDYDELYEPLEQVAKLLSTLDRDIRGQWALSWETDGDDPDSLTFVPLARLGVRPEFPQTQVLSEDTVPYVDRFPGAGLEADVRDLIDHRIHVEIDSDSGITVDACDATLAVLNRVRGERGSW